MSAYRGSVYASSHPPSPIPQYQSFPQQPQPYSPPAGGIQPGSITYTTSAGPDGRLVYHPFKAIPASYQNERGEVIRGIQWVPAELTHVMPEGAFPANQDFVRSWGGQLDPNQAKELRDWEKAQLKQIKKEEKKARKAEQARQSQQGWEQISHSEAHGADTYGRERRKSVNYGQQSPYGPPATSPYAPPATPSAYPAPKSNSGYPNHGGMYDQPPQPYGSAYAQGARYSPNPGHSPNPSADLDRQFSEMTTRERKNSTIGGARPYSALETDRTRRQSIGQSERPVSVYGNKGVYGPAATTPSRPYSVAPGSNIIAPRASPYSGPIDLGQSGHYSSGHAGSEMARSHSPNPMNRSRTPAVGPPAVYPVGHVMEGQPIPNRQGAQSRAQSRATTPNPGGPMSNVPVPFPVHGQSGGISPNMGSNERQLRGEQPEPEAFRRAVNAALPYTPFQPMKISHNMNEFAEHIPRMPLVLQPHDVMHEDWYRLMQDIAAAWTGNLPTSDPEASRRPSKLAALLIDQWNAQFFLPRHVEVVLYKGNERRSGPFKGIRDIPVSAEDDSSSSSSSSSSSDLSSDDEGKYASSYGIYARPDQLSEARVARNQRREKKERRKQRAKEKRARRKQKETDKTYSLYLRSVPRNQPAPAGTAASIPSYANAGLPPSASYGAVPGTYPSTASGGYPSYPNPAPSNSYTPSSGSGGTAYSPQNAGARGGYSSSGYGGAGAGYPVTGFGGSPSGYAPPGAY